MKFRIIQLIIIITSLMLFSQPSQMKTEQLKILLFTPTSKQNTYWPQVHKIMQSAAKELYVNLEIHQFDVDDRFSKHIEGVKILNREPKADAAIFSVAFGQSKPLLEAVEKLGIPTIIHGPLFDTELNTLGGRPRKKFKLWIGYFLQDEEKKGYLLGKLLIAEAIKNSTYAKDGFIHIVGIGGDHSWFGSKLRESGLQKAVNEEPKAKLLQIVPTLWTSLESKSKTQLLLARYPEISVVWSASDQLAIGAASALEESGEILGKTAFTGGLDLSVSGLQEIKNKRFVTTIASSTYAYAEMLILLHDYLHGIDFKSDVGTVIKTRLHIATSQNVKKYLQLYKYNKVINYKRFSKVYNKRLSHYNFTLDRLLKASNN